MLLRMSAYFEMKSHLIRKFEVSRSDFGSSDLRPFHILSDRNHDSPCRLAAHVEWHGTLIITSEQISQHSNRLLSYTDFHKLKAWLYGGCSTAVACCKMLIS
jgi:hypothetical protein